MFTRNTVAHPSTYLPAGRLEKVAGNSFFVARLTLLFPVLIIAATWFQPVVDPAWLYLDTLEAIRRSGDCCHVYYGLVSNLGVFLWIATSAVCLFATLLLFGLGRATGSSLFLPATAGIFSGILGFDDLFQLHEKLFPFLGVPEKATLLMYGLILLMVIVAATRTRGIFDWMLFVLAIAMFAVSIGIDQVFHNDLSLRIVVEDGAKFIGIVSWSACLVSSVFRILLQAGGPAFSGNTATVKAFR